MEMAKRSATTLQGNKIQLKQQPKTDSFVTTKCIPVDPVNGKI